MPFPSYRMFIPEWINSLSRSIRISDSFVFLMLSPKLLRKKRVERAWKIPSLFQTRRFGAASGSRASLTIETSLSLTLFLLFVMSLGYLFVVMQTRLRLQQALEQVSSEAAQYAYVSSQAGLGESESKLMELAGDLLLTELGEEALRLRFLSAAGRDYLNASCVVGGAAGISLEDSSGREDGRIRLTLSYQIRLPFAAFGDFTFTVRQHSYRYAWVGDQGVLKETDPAGGAETIVYVTQNSQVYHLTLGCSYLNLTVRRVPFDAVAGLRNDSGGRYYACELCRPDGRSAVVYITEDGSRYHDDRECGGISRSVTALPLSEAEGRRPCSRCAGSVGSGAEEGGQGDG